MNPTAGSFADFLDPVPPFSPAPVENPGDPVTCGPSSPHWGWGAEPPDGTGYPPEGVRKLVLRSGPNPAATDHTPDPATVKAVTNTHA